MTLTPEEKSTVMKMVAERYYQEFVQTFGKASENYGLTILEAARLSGWSEKWIRRNLGDIIYSAEGQNDKIQFGDLKQAIDDRKGGKVC